MVKNIEQEEDAYSIVSYILDDLFKIHNQANGNGYTIQDGDKRKKIKTTDDLVNWMHAHSGKFQSDNRYQEFIKYVSQLSNKGEGDFDTVWKKTMALAIQKHVQKRAEARDELTKVSLPSAYGSKFNPCKFTPRKMLNDQDFEILKGFEFFEKGGLVYFNLHGNYTLIGSVSELQTRNSAALRKAAKLVTMYNTERTGIKDWDLWDWCYRVCDRMTDEFMDKHRTLETMIKEDIPIDAPVQLFWIDKEITWRELLQLPNGPAPMDAMDKLHSAFSKAAMNKLLPGIMINKGLGNLFIEMDDEWFKRYAFRPSENSGKKCSLQDYLMAAFSELPSLLQVIPQLKEQPRVISDIPGANCCYRMREDWMKNLPEGQKPLSECLAIKAFLSHYTRDEQLAIMAFAYTVWHPSTNDPINLCLKSGGGTFKTNTYVKYIIKLLDLMYSPSGSIVHVMIGDNWVTDPARLENASGDGVSTAALVFNDECTEKSINKFKDMSGGSTDGGVYYQKRIMRENPTEMKIYGKWIFCTNVDFQIQDSEGSFDRRLGLIDRMDIKKLDPPYKCKNFEAEKMKELKAFYELAKKCYELVVNEHGSLSSFMVNCREINKNLKQAYNEDSKTLAYYQLWNSIQQMMLGGGFTDDFIAKNNEDGSVSVSKISIKSEIEKLSEEYEINPAGFVKWITNTESCTGANRTRITIRNGNDVMLGCRLYPLKDECIPKPDTDMNEDKPDVDSVTI